MNKIRDCIILKFAKTQPYESIWQAMRKHIDTKPETDEIWFLEHEPVYTQWQAGLDEHVLQLNQIPIVHSDRGGQITYHGPGQLIVYTLINLRTAGIGIRSMVTLLENCVIELLMTHGVTANSKIDAPGVYVNDAKIASLGLRVRHGYCYHGLAINIDMDLRPFTAINPCGYKGLQVTQISALAPDITKEKAINFITKYFQNKLKYRKMILQ